MHTLDHMPQVGALKSALARSWRSGMASPRSPPGWPGH